MSKKIGIKVEYNGKKFDVITCEDLPTHNICDLSTMP
jgi:hypothetical protein